MNNKADGFTALYERLSRDDEQLGESNSIVNQKQMLEDYAAKNGYPNCVHYTDDGYSGGSFDRPAWKKMMEDIDAGRISTVIAKDMSRIGRNYLEVGYYTEVLFSQKNIHFIAIANGVDSSNQSSSEFAPFLNVMNEWYLRDCSRKIKASKQVLGNSGKHLSAHAAYGYKKDPEDKHHWLIDEEAAEVVKKIFRLCIDGLGTQEISRVLQREKIESPAYYQARHGFGRYKYNPEKLKPYNWSATMIRDIIKKPEYLGYTVNFRTSSKSYKEKVNIQNPPEKWAVFEGTQEPIVDLETWQLCQKLLDTPRRYDTFGEANPLTGLVFCADCGAKMINHRSRPRLKRDGTKDPGFDSYDCSTYKWSSRGVETLCSGHHISTKALREIVLFTIKTVSGYAITNREDFIERVRQASEIRREENAKDIRRKLNRDKKRYAELDLLYKKLYESYAVGKIPEDKFTMLSESYEQEQRELKTAIEENERAVSEYEKDSVNIDSFISLVKKYTDFSELTAPMINEFIDKIIVHAPDRSSGDRVQKVDVYLNFIGNIEVPAPDPTPEEIEQMKIKQYWKERYRKTKDRELARRKKQREELNARIDMENERKRTAKVSAAVEELKKSPPTLPFETRKN